MPPNEEQKMAQIEPFDLLDLINKEDILEYIVERSVSPSASNDLPSWEELNVIFNREGAEGVIQLFGNIFHNATGKEFKWPH